MAPKNYTVRQMEKEPGFAEEVAMILKRAPLTTLRNARAAASRLAFLRKIRNAGVAASEIKKTIAGAVADITAAAGQSVDNPAWHLRPTTLAALVADLTEAAGANPRALRAQALAMLTSHVGEKDAAAMVAAEDTI